MSSYLFPFIQTGYANSNGGGNSNYANFAGNIVNSSQPNITSVGNLTSLIVTNNVTANNFIGNFSGNANFANYAGNVTSSSQPNITNIGTLTSLGVSGNSNLNNLNANGNINFTGSNVSLGSANNLHITGGNNGYFLQTDGTGNLTWSNATGSGNGMVAGANTQIQYNNAGNFGATSGFTFDSSTSNMEVPNWINSGYQNGNAYMVGWSNTLPVTSLFLGAFTTLSTNGLASSTLFKPIIAGKTYDILSLGELSGNTNQSSYSSIFNANNRPGIPGLVISGTTNVLIPIVRNTTGNSQVAVYLSNSRSGTTNIISVGNISNGGQRNICLNTLNDPNVYRYAIISTDSTENNLYVYLGKNTSNAANADWSNTYTLPITSGYHPTDCRQDSSGTANGSIESKILCILNANNFANNTEFALIAYNANSNTMYIAANGTLGTVNNYARFSKDNSMVFSAYPGVGLGKVATVTTNTSNNTISTVEYNLPTVTSNATTSFAYDVKKVGNIVYASCYDNSNIASNYYWAVGTIANSNISWQTYTTSQANLPVSFDSINSLYRSNSIMFYGISQPSNTVARLTRLGPNSTQWEQASNATVENYTIPTTINSNLIGLTSNSYSYFEITNSSNVNSNSSSNTIFWSQAVSSIDDLGIPNISNVAYNTFNGNNFINERRFAAFAGTSGTNPNWTLSSNTGTFMSLGSTLDIAGNGLYSATLFIRTS